MWKKWILLISIALSSTIHAAETKVLALSGSLQENSMNKKLLIEATAIAREMGAEVTLIDLNDYPLPFYNSDIETKSGMPEKAKQLRNQMIQSNVILIASPEYNGSVSGVLKNVIDWASRNETGSPSRDAFKGKTFILMSASPGSHGGVNGLAHLRAILLNIGGTVAATQITLPNAYDAFDAKGHLKNEKVRKEIQETFRSIFQPQVATLINKS